MVNCRNGVVIERFKVGDFWEGFESIKGLSFHFLLFSPVCRNNIVVRPLGFILCFPKTFVFFFNFLF